MSKIEAIDRMNWAVNRIEFMITMFRAANQAELAFNENGLCGMCEALRDISDLINDASIILQKKSPR